MDKNVCALNKIDKRESLDKLMLNQGQKLQQGLSEEEP